MVDIFHDKMQLRTIREDHLNKTIELANSNLAKVTGLQAVVYKSYTKTHYDPAKMTLSFETADGSPSPTIDFNLMFSQLCHGVNINKRGGLVYTNVENIEFNGNVEVVPDAANKGVTITVPALIGDTGAQNGEVKAIYIKGNKGTTNLDGNGNLTIDLPAGGGGSTITGQINDSAPEAITNVRLVGDTTRSVLSGGELRVDLPSQLVAKKGGASTYTRVDKISLSGNTARTTFASGDLGLYLPFLEAKWNNTNEVDIASVNFTGYRDWATFSGDTLQLRGTRPIVFKDDDGITYEDIGQVKLSGAHVTHSGQEIDVSFPPMFGKSKPAEAMREIKSISLTGNTEGSKIDAGGGMTVNVPFTQGSVDGATYQDVKKIKLAGNRAGHSIIDGEMTITIPTGGGGGGGSITGEVEGGTGAASISHIYVTGNIGTSTVASDTLTINLPTGGTGGGGDLTVTDGTKTVTAVEEIEFDNALITELTTPKHGVKVHMKGIDVDVKGDGTLKPLKQLKFTGRVKDNGFVDADGEATINIPQTMGKVGGSTEAVDLIEITGNVGVSGIHDGKLTIDLPTGGGGGGTGGPIKGIVGTENGDVNSIQIAGNIEGSSIDTSTGRMVVRIPEKVGFYDGTDTIEKVDLVQVAHSSMKEVDKGGKKLVVITPELMVFFNGWFESFEAMENGVNKATRIPTKTCAYAMDRVSNPSLPQHKLYIWMPNSTTGNPEWQEVMVNGSLPFKEGTDTTGRVLSITKNNMVTINNNTGELTVRDVSVPQVLVDINNGPGTVKKGHFTKLSFTDGPSWADLDTTTMELTLQRPIRRGGYGVDVTGTHPEWGDKNYEGTIVFNQDGKEWWGYDDTTAATEQHKWKPIAYGGMSDDVKDLVDRVPPKLKLIDKVGLDDDDLAWKYSGWTGVPKHATDILPPSVEGKTGMVIQTFMGPTGAAGLPDQTGRIQIGYVGSDASIYKRHRDETLSKWSDWVKVSFNPGDLAEHNKDPHAHRAANPYYKTITFDCTYKALNDSGNWLPISSMHLLGSSNGKHGYNDDGFATVPYDGKYRVRGHLYIAGADNITSPLMKGTWRLLIDKRVGGAGGWVSVYTADYIHHSTTLPYPPLKWDSGEIPLKSGDDVKIGIIFLPDGSTTISQWMGVYKNLSFYGLRSYVSIDEVGNDGGHALGETHRLVHGHFVGVKDTGLKIFWDETQGKNRVVDETIVRFETQMLP